MLCNQELFLFTELNIVTDFSSNAVFRRQLLGVQERKIRRQKNLKWKINQFEIVNVTDLISQP